MELFLPKEKLNWRQVLLLFFLGFSWGLLLLGSVWLLSRLRGQPELSIILEVLLVFAFALLQRYALNKIYAAPRNG